jgi:hypothetical protein
MNANSDLPFVEHEKYFELCALAPTGELSAEESARLEKHAAACRECRELLAIYRGPALQRMASLGAIRNADHQDEAVNLPHESHGSVSAIDWNQEKAKDNLLAAATGRGRSKSPRVPIPALASAQRLRTAPGRFQFQESRVYLGAAAVLLLAVALAYHYGYNRAEARYDLPPANLSRDSALNQQIAKLESERQALDKQLALERQTIDTLTGRVNEREAQTADLKNHEISLTAQNQQKTEALTAGAAERSELLQKLDDSEQLLKAARDDLSVERSQHQNTLLRTASLETQIGELSAKLRERDDTIGRQDQYLVADRDVRELMGARQLYIADVFDVDGGGETRKPFGRVFYTKAKSLVFYAFDLDRMPGYKQAKTFQAWAREGQDGSKPVSLGIFYMDNEANRRWVLKSEDPDTLAQIDAVFVTVEPKGGSTKPSGKPFLYAYLHKAPLNHP